MKAVLALAASCLALSVARAEDEAVVVATDANWADVVEKEELVLVEFYAPWCGHCKSLAPKYEEAAKILKELDKPIVLAKVDATEEKKVAGAAGVSGYPTMKIYRNGEMSDYDGGREADDIVKYMKEQTGPASTELTTSKDLKATINKKTLDHVAVIGYFSSATSVDYKIFMQVANKYRGKFAFYHVQSQSVLENIGYYGSTSAVGMYRPWAGGKQFKKMYAGAIYKQALTDFVVEQAFPAVGYIAEDQMEFITQKNKPIVKVFVSTEKREELEKGIVKELTPIEKKHGKKLAFVINDFGSSQFGFSDAELETGKAIVVDDPKKKFVYDDSQGTVAEWVEKYLKKQATPWVKSEAPVPRVQPGEVQVVVGKTFDEIVMDKTKDVFIEFYAPWCGHCKQLEPKYNELAKELAGQKNIIIAKLDATANDVQYKAYQAQGFPTMKFATTNSKETPLEYDGGRDVADMLKWIKEKATVAEEEL
eukprot:TRINITY_DN454_c0_g1_i1.p1 TRINITY_DN454_c0_g1~~TRINITY_DN454_c0_g1_i1.p1  ORF type:complete len:479 (+),score=246.86 TRINITY_DN454_c0_g1_i1:76-1512(+)